MFAAGNFCVIKTKNRLVGVGGVKKLVCEFNTKSRFKTTYQPTMKSFHPATVDVLKEHKQWENDMEFIVFNV